MAIMLSRHITPSDDFLIRNHAEGARVVRFGDHILHPYLPANRSDDQLYQSMFRYMGVVELRFELQCDRDRGISFPVAPFLMLQNPST